MEDKILEQVKKALGECISKELCGYKKPLSVLVGKVIDRHQAEVVDIIDNEFVKLLGGDGFKDSLKDALNAKMARVLVSKMGGELEKRVNELKQNPETRAKITLAVGNIIKEL